MVDRTKQPAIPKQYRGTERVQGARTAHVIGGIRVFEHGAGLEAVGPHHRRRGKPHPPDTIELSYLATPTSWVVDKRANQNYL